MTSVSVVDCHGRQWELVPRQNDVCARRIADGVATPTVLFEELLAEYGPLMISAEEPTLRVGAREKLADVIDLVVTDPETASIEQIREVASLARLLLHRHPA